MLFESFNKSLLKLFSYHDITLLYWIGVGRGLASPQLGQSMSSAGRQKRFKYLSSGQRSCLGDILGNNLLTAVVKLVDFQLVDSAEGVRLPQLYVVAVLWNDGRLSALRVGVPKGVCATVLHMHHAGVCFRLLFPGLLTSQSA